MGCSRKITQRLMCAFSQTPYTLPVDYAGILLSYVFAISLQF